MFIKIMSEENMADSNIAKQHKIIETNQYSFEQNDDGFIIRYIDILTKLPAVEHVPHCNVYVMNNEGKTINSFQPPKLSLRTDVGKIDTTKAVTIIEDLLKTSSIGEVTIEKLFKKLVVFGGVITSTLGLTEEQLAPYRESGNVLTLADGKEFIRARMMITKDGIEL